MAYYILKHAVNTKDTGPIYPQIQKMSSGYNYKAPNSVYALSKASSALPDFIPNLDHFIVNNKAKLTDLLSVSMLYGGLLVSSRFKEILERFTLPSHQFYSARVHYKNTFYEYYWLHIVCNLTDFINYKKSHFIIYQNYRHSIGKIDITSKEDFETKKQQIIDNNPGKAITIWSEKICFNDHFENGYDLFEIGTFDANYYCSEQLESAMLQHKISGINIIPANNLIT